MKILYKLCYMVSGMFLLMALALMASGTNQWSWWLYSISTFYLAVSLDNASKAPRG